MNTLITHLSLNRITKSHQSPLYEWVLVAFRMLHQTLQFHIWILVTKPAHGELVFKQE